MTKHYVRPEDALTLELLPKHGYLVVYATAEVWTNEAIEFGSTDRSGWVSSLDQPDEPVQARNDVDPLFMAYLPLNEDERGELADVLAMLGPVDSDSGSTIYATGTKTYDMATDEVWRYAVRAHVKNFSTVTMRWSEEPALLLV